MKINEKFKIRKVVGEYIVLLQGRGGSDMSHVISFNSTSAALWEAFFGKDFTREDAIQYLLDNYEVTAETAAADVDAWIGKLRSTQPALILD